MHLRVQLYCLSVSRCNLDLPGPEAHVPNTLAIPAHILS